MSRCRRWASSLSRSVEIDHFNERVIARSGVRMERQIVLLRQIQLRSRLTGSRRNTLPLTMRMRVFSAMKSSVPAARLRLTGRSLAITRNAHRHRLGLAFLSNSAETMAVDIADVLCVQEVSAS